MKINRPFWFVLAALIACLGSVHPLAAEPSVSNPFTALGARATADARGAGMGIHAVPDGARLHTIFQKLSGRVNAQGLWLDSTADKDGRLHLAAGGIGRGGRRLSSRRAGLWAWANTP